MKEELLENILQSLPSLRYQMGLAILFTVVIIWDLLKGDFWQKSLPILTVLGLVINAVISFTATDQLLDFEGLHGLGQASFYLNYLIALLAILVIVFDRVLTSEKRLGEYYAILLAMMIGLSFILLAKNLLILYLAIETVSICSYILTAFKFNKLASEAALKYILFGAFSSATMLYGISLLYGLTGSLDFAEVFSHNMLEASLLAKLGLGFALAGLFFKLSAVPFHIWTPDVYEAAPTPMVAFFSIAPKAAVIYIVHGWTVYLGENELFTALIAIVALVSIFYGNLSALKQKSLKRMLAYSSIAHAGFLLIAALASAEAHLHFYLSIYFFMNLIAFGLAAWLEKEKASDQIEDFKGIGLQIPFLGVITLIAMISLAGLPITAGFNAKLLIFIDLWTVYTSSASPVLLALLVLGLANIVISLFYYLRLPYFMFFTKSEASSLNLYPIQKLFFGLLAFPLLLFFFKPDWLIQWIVLLN